MKRATILGMISAFLHVSVALSAEVTPPPFEASLGTYYGQNLAPEASEQAASLSFTPELIYRPVADTTLSLSSWIDRPTDPYKNFEVPRTLIGASQRLDLIENLETRVLGNVNLMSLDRWNADGYTIRSSVNAQARKEVLPNLTVTGRLGPFVQFNQYTQTTSGVTLPTWGLGERVSLDYVLGDFSLSGTVIFAQARAGSVWRNDIYTAESIEYAVAPSTQVGLLHELVSGGIDSTTGYARPIRFFHERESRISAYVTVRM